MRTRILVVLFGIVALAQIPSPASAGGGSWWESNDDTPLVGQTVRVRTETDYGDSARTVAQPHTLYLIPQRSGGIDRGRVPATAVSLGGITQSLHGGMVRASATFTIPDVPTGIYELQACTSPCHQTDLSVAWGQLMVAHTVEEQQLYREVGKLEGQLQRAQRDMKSAEKELQQLQATNDLALPVPAIQQPTIVGDSSAEPRPNGLTGFALGIVVATMIALVLSLIRRRRSPPGTPIAVVESLPLESPIVRERAS